MMKLAILHLALLFRIGVGLLVWPEGASKILVITGFGIPVDIDPETIIIGTVIKGNYILPMNTSYLQNPITTFQRRKRSSSRWNLYETLGRLIEMRGLQGKACILRTICEFAQDPLEKNYGLFHELLHLFFTPSTTNEKVGSHQDNEYYAAQVLGKKNVKCDRVFPDCETGFIDLFTTLH